MNVHATFYHIWCVFVYRVELVSFSVMFKYFKNLFFICLIFINISAGYFFLTSVFVFLSTFIRARYHLSFRSRFAEFQFLSFSRLYVRQNWANHALLTSISYDVHSTMSSQLVAHYWYRHINTLHHITYTSHHIISHHIASHHITSHRITSHHITSHHITSHYITSHHITSHNITSHHITSHYIILYYITLHYITLHYITLKLTVSLLTAKLDVRLTL